MTTPTTATTHTDFTALLPTGQLRKTVQQWLDDDMPSMMDVGGLVVGQEPREAKLWMKSPGVFAGKVFFDTVFDLLGCTVEWNTNNDQVEGNYLEASSTHKLHLATVRGPANDILRGERTALNAISRCSGVASLSYEATQAAKLLNWHGYVAGTRKTTPGFRIVEKYALLVGGAATHRLDLSQMVMLKDNHIWSAGSITKAVTLARKAAGFSQKIEVECLSLTQAIEAATAGADIVMLDNFPPHQLKQDAKALKLQFPHLIIEASGGITTQTMPQYLSQHIDVVSQGNLTQGYPCVDYSLKIVPPS